MLRAKRCGWMLGLVLLVLTAVGGNAAPLHPEPPGPTTPLFECTGNGEIGPIEKPVDGPLAWIVGDFIWDDLNRNGIQDPAEPGLAGVECLLCIASRTQPLQRRTTSSQGYYAFTGVPAGNFFIARQRRQRAGCVGAVSPGHGGRHNPQVGRGSVSRDNQPSLPAADSEEMSVYPKTPKFPGR